METLATDPQAADRLKADPGQLKTLAAEAVATADSEEQRLLESRGMVLDANVYKTVVQMLGLSVILSVVSIAGISIYTIFQFGNGANLQVAIPDGIVALASASVGALAGLLTPLGGRR
ncbi:hypothetical protein ABLE93_05530 [Xanthobacter sp. KR7-65]|uniref:hypothetical protein n=1 Tax=Xanthobacter sp. KR7-65 TaxID=3156612 RepID=UPI0032B35613